MMTEEPDRMTTMDGSMMPGGDAWLESLLRADAAQQPHLDDAGFSARVMSALPVARKPVSRWLVPAMAVLGGAAAVGLTPAAGNFAVHFLELLDVRHFSLANLTILVVPLAVLYACSFAAVREN